MYFFVLILSVPYTTEELTSYCHFLIQSQLHGISRYEWAVGTTPGGEDIQPLTSDGVVPGSDPSMPGNIYTKHILHQGESVKHLV